MSIVAEYANFIAIIANSGRVELYKAEIPVYMSLDVVCLRRFWL